MFHGSMVAIVTPMQEGGQIDFESFASLIEHHIAAGTDALVIAGTTGESATLTLDEKKQLVSFAVELVHGRIPVIAGSHAESTQEAIDLTQMVMEQGADACLIMTPAYIKPTQDGLLKHYKAIAQRVAIPQIVYNVPGRTQCDLLPETLAQLADITNIIGVKEASGTVERVKRIKELCGDKIDIYSGDDLIACESMQHGAKGVISVTANVAPKLMAEMMHAALNGDFATANQLNQQLQNLHKAMFVESNPIPCKWALAHLGLIPAGIRLPLTPLAPEHQALVAEAVTIISG